MKRIFIMAVAAGLLGGLTTGCYLNSCNSVFPKPTWYWSKAAVECRREHAAEQEYQSTNHINQLLGH
jgi:hypothetical protein